MNKLAQGAAAEFVGTLLFVFIGIGVIVSTHGNPGSALLPIALGHGLALGIVITCFMYISGGQINPAVSVALVLARKQSPANAAVFIVAQLLGAACAAGLIQVLFTPDKANSEAIRLGATYGTFTGAGHYVGVLGLEAICTFMLMTSVLLGAVDARVHKLGGFVIGLTVAACILVAGPYTGASMNPARTFGPAVCGGRWDMHWAYWVGPLIGACLAAAVYRAFWETPAPSTEGPRA